MMTKMIICKQQGIKSYTKTLVERYCIHEFILRCSTVIKCIHNRELRRSGSNYILQESTLVTSYVRLSRSYVTTFRLANPRIGNKTTWTQGRTPTWDPTSGLISM